VHVAFLDAGKAFNGRSVEPDAIFEGGRQLLCGNGDIFDDADHIGKLQVNELDLVLFGTR